MVTSISYFKRHSSISGTISKSKFAPAKPPPNIGPTTLKLCFFAIAATRIRHSRSESSRIGRRCTSSPPIKKVLPPGVDCDII